MAPTDTPPPRRPAPSEPLTDGPAVVPREAATVIVVRDGPPALEVLLVQRNPAARFMGGAWVFPGGSLTAADANHAAAAARELEEEAGVNVEPDALLPFSRWITPAQIAVRFDTWFFVTAATRDVEPTPDGTETVAARWIAPSEALAAGERGELALMFPTVRHLEELSRFSSAGELLAAAETRTIEAIEPRVVERDGKPVVLLPHEPGYDDAGA